MLVMIASGTTNLVRLRCFKYNIKDAFILQINTYPQNVLLYKSCAVVFKTVIGGISSIYDNGLTVIMHD